MLRPDAHEQRRYWKAADERHFRWQTESGYFSSTERALVLAAALPEAGRLLEIGCGEGGNLYHLGGRRGWLGLDVSQAKLQHARSVLPAMSFFRADAQSLPLSDATFDAVLIRDLLHHVSDRDAVIAEAVRVVRPAGVIAVIEPNRWCPLVMAQAALVPAERAVLASHAARVRDELGRAGLVDIELEYAQAFPIARVVTHPALRLDALGATATARRILEAADRVATRVVPRALWMYLVARARKPAQRVQSTST